MAFSPLEQNFNHVESLPDQPSLSQGYSPAELKRVFDQAGKEIKTYLNDTLLSELQAQASGSSGAESIGSAEAGGIPAGTLHQQILRLKTLYDTFDRDFRDAVNGILPPATIAFDRLDSETQTKINTGAGKDRALFVCATPGSHSFTAPKTGTYRIRMCGGGSGGTYADTYLLNENNLTNYAEYFGFGGASASALETYLDLQAGQSFPITVGAGASAASSPFVVGAQNGLPFEVVLDYFRDESYRSQGGASVFGSAEHSVFLICPGGDFNRSAVLPDTGGYTAYPVLTHSGRTPKEERVFPPEGNRDSFFSDSSGADSALGCGGKADAQTPRLPDFGGGGYGGGLTYRSGYFYPTHAPSAGGNGLILIDYIA